MTRGLIVFAMVYSIPSVAQEISSAAAQEFMDNLISQNYFQTELVFDDSFKGTQGSPYFQNNWHGGTFELKDGRRVKADLLYDMIEDQLILKRSVRTGMIIKRDQIKSFQLGEHVFVNKGAHYGYLHQISSGAIKLLVKRGKRMRQASTETTYSTNRDYHQYLEENKYYLQLADASIVKCPQSVGGFTKLFPAHKKAIKSYTKSHQTLFRKEGDLRRLIEHCQYLVGNQP